MVSFAYGKNPNIDILKTVQLIISIYKTNGHIYKNLPNEYQNSCINFIKDAFLRISSNTFELIQKDSFSRPEIITCYYDTLNLIKEKIPELYTLIGDESLSSYLIHTLNAMSKVEDKNAFKLMIEFIIIFFNEDPLFYNILSKQYTNIVRICLMCISQHPRILINYIASLLYLLTKFSPNSMLETLKILFEVPEFPTKLHDQDIQKFTDSIKKKQKMKNNFKI